MGAIAESIMAYAQPLIDATDGSLEQLNKALGVGQICWNLAISNEQDRRSILNEMRSSLGMSEAEFADFEHNVVRSMIVRHEEMFPGLHRRSAIGAPRSGSSFGRDISSELYNENHDRSPPPIDVDQLIRELDAAFRVFPEAALRACQKHREAVTPRLIDVLLEAARLGREGVIREGNAPVFALMLLGEFETAEALPAIMALLESPNKTAGDLLGDSLNEDVPRILATLAHDQLETIDSLIGNKEAYEFARWGAAESYKYLVRDGRMMRHDAVMRLAALLRQAIDSKDESCATFLVSILTDLNANEAITEIDQAFDRELIDESMFDRQFVNEHLRPNEPESCPEFRWLGPTKIANAVEEIRHWHWPGEIKKSSSISRIARSDYNRLVAPAMLDAVDDDFYQADTIRKNSVRVGRNDSCPCGSGKKYKKCCLRSIG